MAALGHFLLYLWHMAIKIPDNIDQLKALCGKYQKQLMELTQKCDRESLKAGMEEYYLNQKIADFESLCKQNGVDFSIVNERDAHRREPHKEEN